MAERHNMRQRSDGRNADRGGSSGRRSMVYVPGEASDFESHRRGSARYSSSTRRSREGRTGASSRPLPASASVKPVRVGLIAGLAFLLVCAFVLVGFVLASNSGGSANRATEAMQVIETSEKVATGVEAVGGVGPSTATQSPKDIDSSAMLQIPGSDQIMSVKLDKGSASTEACSFDTAGIKSAIAAIEEYGDCGFVFVDMNSGNGLAYNADEEIYIASAAKAVLTLYALTNGAGANEWERYNIEEAITYSDNDAYEGFAYNYSGDGYYGEWLNAHGVWFDDYVFDLYPPMSARSLASFWVEILQYLRSGSDEAQWFAGLLGSTETSFIRDAVSNTGATVVNKGGWIGEEGYESVTDAGIIELDGRTYLMVIITGQFDDEGVTEPNVANLAQVLFGARDLL